MRQGRGPVPGLEAAQAEVVQGVGDPRLVAGDPPEGEALGVVGDDVGELALPPGDPAGGLEGAGGEARVVARAGQREHGIGPPARLGQVAPLLPEAPERAHEAEGDLGERPLRRVGQGGPEVLVLALEPFEPPPLVVAGQVRLGGLGEVEVGAGVALADRIRLARARSAARAHRPGSPPGARSAARRPRRPARRGSGRRGRRGRRGHRGPGRRTRRSAPRARARSRP